MGFPVSDAMRAALTGASPTAGTVAASGLVVPDASKNLSTFGALTATDFDAGSSGVAGSVDVFPSTASKGKLSITCTDQTGNTTVGVNVAAMAAARSLSIADPLADADFILGKQAAVARTATADGLTTGTIAAAGRFQHITVTSADANHIIVLPTPTPGTVISLANGGTGYELRSSTPASIAINGGSGSNAESAIPASAIAVVWCTSATTWIGLTITGTTLASMEAAA